jgi:hypothetical protein
MRIIKTLKNMSTELDISINTLKYNFVLPLIAKETKTGIKSGIIKGSGKKPTYLFLYDDFINAMQNLNKEDRECQDLSKGGKYTTSILHTRIKDTEQQLEKLLKWKP